MGKLSEMAAVIKTAVSDKHTEYVAGIAASTTSMEDAKAVATTQAMDAIAAIDAAEQLEHQSRVEAEEALVAERTAIVQALKSEEVDDGVITSLKEVDDANKAYGEKYEVDLDTTADHQKDKVGAYELERGGFSDFQEAFEPEIGEE
tara:strand:+ start:1609 stop:2049 length:441 start_codon:yes stop_codon:yes gene_type:complete